MAYGLPPIDFANLGDSAPSTVSDCPCRCRGHSVATRLLDKDLSNPWVDSTGCTAEHQKRASVSALIPGGGVPRRQRNVIAHATPRFYAEQIRAVVISKW